MGKISFKDFEEFSNSDAYKRVDENANSMSEIVMRVVNPFCSDLDAYIQFIKDCLHGGEQVPTNDELDDFCLNLSTLLYFASSACEKLGIKDDISNAVYKDVYHHARNALEGGTVADKNSVAEIQSQAEQLVSICYSRAYRLMKSKVESGQELLNSVKKVLSRRMSEFELTRAQR